MSQESSETGELKGELSRRTFIKYGAGAAALAAGAAAIVNKLPFSFSPSNKAPTAISPGGHVYGGGVPVAVSPVPVISGTSIGTGMVQGTMTVTGTGQDDVPPDKAIVTVGVVTQASTAEAAVQDNSGKMSQILSGLNSIGISNSDIQTTSYNISPLETYPQGGPPTITGYQVTNNVQVTLHESGLGLGQLGSRISQVIDTATSNGANQVYGVQFTASGTPLQQARQAALQQAAQDALQQAQVIASALNFTIVGVLSVSTNPGYYYPQVYSFDSLRSASTPVVPPQSLAVSSTVQAVFSID